MGWRVFRRIRIAPGLRLNVSKSGPSISVGGRGFTTTFGRRGRRTTIGIPGTGVYHTTLEPWDAPGEVAPSVCPSCGHRVGKTARYCSSCGAAV